MKYVLFVCTHNAGRSQIAQAFFEPYAPADVRASPAATNRRRAEEIRACADLMLQPFDDAPVRSFVLTLAWRNAQECLREGRCADLA